MDAAAEAGTCTAAVSVAGMRSVLWAVVLVLAGGWLQPALLLVLASNTGMENPTGRPGKFSFTTNDTEDFVSFYVWKPCSANTIGLYHISFI